MLALLRALRSNFGRRHSRPARTCPLRVEALEDRLTPSGPSLNIGIGGRIGNYFSFAGVGFRNWIIAGIEGYYAGTSQLDNNPNDYTVYINWGDNGNQWQNVGHPVLDNFGDGYPLDVKASHVYQTASTTPYDVQLYAVGPNGTPSYTADVGSFSVVPMPSDPRPGIVKFGTSHLGQGVPGPTGQYSCWDFVAAAFKSAGAQMFAPTGPNANYVWGNNIGTFTPGNSQAFANLAPGDVLQFRNVIMSYPNGSTQTYGHHSAIVLSVNNSNGTVTILEQHTSINGGPTRLYVTQRVINLGLMTQGTVWAYQPVSVPTQPAVQPTTLPLAAVHISNHGNGNWGAQVGAPVANQVIGFIDGTYNGAPDINPQDYKVQINWGDDNKWYAGSVQATPPGSTYPAYHLLSSPQLI